MNFVDKQNAVAVLLKLFQQRFETLLKVTAVFGARQQRTDIQRIDGAIGHNFRHVTLHNTPCQTFGNRRLTDTGFPHQQRVIFTATTENLNSALKLFVTPNQRVNTADTSKLIEIGGEVFHTFLPACLLFIIRLTA